MSEGLLKPEARNALSHIGKDILITGLVLVGGCEYVEKRIAEKKLDEMQAILQSSGEEKISPASADSSSSPDDLSLFNPQWIESHK